MSSGFVSEKELEKMRESGLEPRVKDPNATSLYDRLQENKRVADELFAERIKFQPPRGLDEDEITFLEEKQREEERRRLEQEETEKQELADFRRSSNVTETSTIIFNLPAKKKSEVKPIGVKVIAVKSKATTNPNTNTNTNTATNNATTTITKRKEEEAGKDKDDKPKKILKSETNSPSLKTSLGILADYSSSDESDKETKSKGE
eukprot:TRINITY_DN13459_c0_g1_i1.p2 TRINITY_DN13459_c0_g1~~TRINITY_DN13459_c0_g1_i1.p2  ORF type:complete len:205 (-),score=70.46 TRINITY_DN13459_c0_g1_i1:167-781(-)